MHSVAGVLDSGWIISTRRMCGRFFIVAAFSSIVVMQLVFLLCLVHSI